jgi:hypothetical protein
VKKTNRKLIVKPDEILGNGNQAEKGTSTFSSAISVRSEGNAAAAVMPPPGGRNEASIN